MRVSSRAELLGAFAEAREADRTTVIVVEIDPDERLPSFDTWWDVPVAEVSASPDVEAARARYEAERKAQRWHV